MKFRYLAGLLIALSFNSGFAADVEIDASDYQGIYEAFTRRSAADINAALKNNQDFNHKADGDAIRSSATGLALRTAVIGLGFADLKTVVEINHAFFKTSLGVSLLHGWALNHFKDAGTPYYIGYYFSFNRMLQGLAERITDTSTRTFLKAAFTRGLAAVEADRWAFYDHMLYLPYAIAQVRLTAPAGAGALPVDAVIADARRSTIEARVEAANLVRAPGKAMHLFGDLGDRDANWAANTFVGLQKYTLLDPTFCETIDPVALEIFQSLPDDTDIDAFTFMGHTVLEHMTAFRDAIHKRRYPLKEDGPKKQLRSSKWRYVAIIAGGVAVVAFLLRKWEWSHFRELVRR